MPNHCSNKLTVTGPVDQVDAFVAACKAPRPTYDGRVEVADFTFNGVVPIPSEVIARGFGGHVINKFRHLPFEQQLVSMDKLPVDQLDGYNAQCRLWGTKWDAYEIEVQASTPGVFVVHFQTAWCLPREWLIACGKKFPSLSFFVSFSCEGPSRGRQFKMPQQAWLCTNEAYEDVWVKHKCNDTESSDCTLCEIENKKFDLYYETHESWVASLVP